MLMMMMMMLMRRRKCIRTRGAKPVGDDHYDVGRGTTHNEPCRHYRSPKSIEARKECVGHLQGDSNDSVHDHCATS